MSGCYECKWLDEDYEYDGEGEYSVYTCLKTGASIDDITCLCDCEFFKKIKPYKHTETIGKCDNCEYFKNCKADKIDCTTSEDMMRHYIPGIGQYCRKGM